VLDVRGVAVGSTALGATIACASRLRIVTAAADGLSWTFTFDVQ
jgi:hypothetical protein